MKFASAIAAAAVLVIPFVGATNSTKPRNYIYFLPDGYGPASETFARDYANYKNNDTNKLPVDNYAIGYVRTYASDTLVTDSAAAATAYGCGIKTYNGAIGVDPSFAPHGNIVEAAKLAGFHTGLVSTSRITHASPAGFSTHVFDRDSEAAIADQLVGYAHPLGRVVDIMMGGGRCFFLPQSDEDSCRDDDVDLWSLAQTDYNWTMTSGREKFDELSNGLEGGEIPFAFIPNLSHMMYEVDRESSLEPSLEEMAITTLNWLDRLSKDSDKGFFLFIEAARIDHAGHSHDPIGHLHDILEYNRAMEAVIQWIATDHTDTALLSGADHECGGLTMGVPDYAWYPEVLEPGSGSAEHFVSVYEDWEESFPNATQDAKNTYVATQIFEPYGIFNATGSEVTGFYNASDPAVYMGNLLAARAGINWSTLGHTAVDITLFGYGINTDSLIGNWNNVEVGHFMASQLGLNLSIATEKLQANESFVGGILADASASSSTKKLRKRLLADHESVHLGHKH
ncbi:alkaline-phosphatase-like protein [Lipomyces oligophaga]|uniref:alkaline-phosphatase-like protein n=1 Tax=Lipomyces oligophaga TaxID=45792 RepID=UPI0034CEF4E4